MEIGLDYTRSRISKPTGTKQSWPLTVTPFEEAIFRNGEVEVPGVSELKSLCRGFCGVVSTSSTGGVSSGENRNFFLKSSGLK
jgi:hypothetical protein